MKFLGRFVKDKKFSPAIWRRKDLVDLHSGFHDEINSGEIAYQSVKTKLKECGCLTQYTNRQVFEDYARIILHVVCRTHRRTMHDIIMC